MPLSEPPQFSRNYVSSEELVSRTLIANDEFHLLYSNNGALVFTVPPDVFAEGVQISLAKFDVAAGLPVFATGVGVTLESSGTLGPTAQFSIASIIRVPSDLAGDDNTWIVVGNV